MFEEMSIALRSDHSFIEVRGLSDLEYLVKESEIVTNQAGRMFHIRSQDRPVYIALESPSPHLGTFLMRRVVSPTQRLPSPVPREQASKTSF